MRQNVSRLLIALALISVFFGGCLGFLVEQISFIEGLCGGTLCALLFCGIDGGIFDDAKPFHY